MKTVSLVVAVAASLAISATAGTVSTIIQQGRQFYNGLTDNVELKNNLLTVGTDATPTTFNSGYRYYGVYTSSENSSHTAFQTIGISLNANAPAGSAISIALRTETAGAWSEWHSIHSGETLGIGGTATGWQYRLTLGANNLAGAPTVQSVIVKLYSSGAQTANALQSASAGHPTYSIYATREGLVGNKTANGHTIVSHDHFVALPSSSALDCNGCSTYTVTLNYPKTGLSVTERVYDVGPWNESDNYWHNPRAEFGSLAVGLPEAQAAYQNGFNGGHDEFGRTVSNPAGIDLADGTFWDSLGMTGNDWVNVTFNWEGVVTSYTVDNSDGGFSASANWTTATSSTDKFGTNYRYHSTVASSDPATWSQSLPSSGSYNVYVWYPQGSNRSTSAPYIISTSSGTSTVHVNQQITGGQWVNQGAFTMNSGANTVQLSCWTTTGFVVMADAVRWTH